MRNYKKWTEAETNFIMDDHHLFNDVTLAMKLTGMTAQNFGIIESFIFKVLEYF